MRTELVEERSRNKQRLERLLEDALIMSSVATDLLGVSPRAMIEALIAGERDPEALADLARGKLTAKRAALLEALDGRFDDHHADLAGLLLDQVDACSDKIDRLTARIEQLVAELPDPNYRPTVNPGAAQRATCPSRMIRRPDPPTPSTRPPGHPQACRLNPGTPSRAGLRPRTPARAHASARLTVHFPVRRPRRWRTLGRRFRPALDQRGRHVKTPDTSNSWTASASARAEALPPCGSPAWRQQACRRGPRRTRAAYRPAHGPLRAQEPPPCTRSVRGPRRAPGAPPDRSTG